MTVQLYPRESARLDAARTALRGQFHVELAADVFLADPDPTDAFHALLAGVPLGTRRLFVATVQAKVCLHAIDTTDEQEQFLEMYAEVPAPAGGYGDRDADVDPNQY